MEERRGRWGGGRREDVEILHFLVVDMEMEKEKEKSSVEVVKWRRRMRTLRMMGRMSLRERVLISG